MKFRKVTADKATADEAQVPPHKPGGSEAKPGFWFATCSCGWKQTRHDEVDDQWAAKLLDEHRQVCAYPLRTLMVPMWSVAWPWYWGPPDAPFGLEMSWRPSGSQSSYSSYPSSGSSPKTWHLFAETKR